MKKNSMRFTKKLLCFAVCIALLLSTLTSVVFADTTPMNQNTLIKVEPLQKVIMQVLSFTQPERESLVKNYLQTVNSTNYETVADNILKNYKLSISKDDLKVGLKAFVAYPNASNKAELLKLCISAELDAQKFDTTGFYLISSNINAALTDKFENDNGIRLFVGLLYYVSKQIQVPIAFDNTDPYKIKFKVDGHKALKDTLNPLFDFVQSLKSIGVTDFDSLLAKTENTINKFPVSEIYALKDFLSKYKGVQIYKGALLKPSPTPTVVAAGTPQAPVVYVTPSPVASSSTSPKVSPTPTDNKPNKTKEPNDKKPSLGDFKDIAKHWSVNFVKSMLEKGFLSGYNDGTIRPDNRITRAEAIALIIKSAGLQPATKITLKHKDIKSIPTWAVGYIQAALDNKIISGYPDNTIRAQNDITRSELVVIVLSAFKFEKAEKANLDKFTDANQIESWAADFIAEAVGLGIVNGYKDKTFKPNNYITRAEAIVIIDTVTNLKNKASAK